MKKITIILTAFVLLINLSACSQKQEEQVKTTYATSSAEKWAEEFERTKRNTYSTYDELEEVLSDYGYDSMEDYVRNHYSISDIWDDWDIEDFVRDNYYWSDIWDEDEIKEDVFETGLIEEWYEEYCSDDYDYYHN